MVSHSRRINRFELVLSNIFHDGATCSSKMLTRLACILMCHLQLFSHCLLLLLNIDTATFFFCVIAEFIYARYDVRGANEDEEEWQYGGFRASTNVFCMVLSLVN